MKAVFSLILVSASVLAKVLPGYIYISKLENDPVHIDLKAEGQTVVLGNSASMFEYGTNGTVKVYNADKYLGFNFIGMLVATTKPSTGFSLKNEAGLKFTRVLSYNGVETFELCQDHSVRYNTNCRGAISVTIIYEDRLLPY